MMIIPLPPLYHFASSEASARAAYPAEEIARGMMLPSPLLGRTRPRPPVAALVAKRA